MEHAVRATWDLHFIHQKYVKDQKYILSLQGNSRIHILQTQYFPNKMYISQYLNIHKYENVTVYSSVQFYNWKINYMSKDSTILQKKIKRQISISVFTFHCWCHPC